MEELAGKDPPEILDIREYHAENRVHFVLEVPGLDKLARTEGGILKKFRLQGSISSRNMVAFSPAGKIVRYASTNDILREFYGLRETLYARRKEYMLQKLRRDYEILVNKVRFVRGVIAEEIQISKVKKQRILARLVEYGLKPMSELRAILDENPAFLKNENPNSKAGADSD